MFRSNPLRWFDTAALCAAALIAVVLYFATAL